MTDAGSAEPRFITRLQSLAARIEDQFGPGVTHLEQDGSGSFMTSPRAGACPLYVAAHQGEVILGLGTASCRWELSHREDDIAFIEALAEAATAGRVSEVFGPGRSQVTVRLGDGTTERAAAAEFPAGCLPKPFWSKSSRRHRNYLPY